MQGWTAFAVALIFSGVLTALAEERGASAVGEAGESQAAWWQQDIWRDPERGFHWYPPPTRPKPPKDDKPKRDEAKPTTAAPTRLEDIRDIDTLRGEVKRRLEAAVMDPTEKNMRDYLEANTLLLRKSALFADQWRRVVWTHPEFDYNTVNPAANFAQIELKAARRYEEERTLRELAADYGLVVFVRADCPFCRMQAPVLRWLSSRFGLELLPISLDRVPNEDYPDARPDNGISQAVSGGAGV
ncbi:MAG TPA: conjugal transfer protein TraF, partial [Burkholderiaceae bacterium]|nr:conjugal transfer protein TraF [Burkholderiaceae bacterium]